MPEEQKRGEIIEVTSPMRWRQPQRGWADRKPPASLICLGGTYCPCQLSNTIEKYKSEKSFQGIARIYKSEDGRIEWGRCWDLEAPQLFVADMHPKGHSFTTTDWIKATAEALYHDKYARGLTWNINGIETIYAKEGVYTSIIGDQYVVTFLIVLYDDEGNLFAWELHDGAAPIANRYPNVYPSISIDEAVAEDIKRAREIFEACPNVCNMTYRLEGAFEAFHEAFAETPLAEACEVVEVLTSEVARVRAIKPIYPRRTRISFSIGSPIVYDDVSYEFNCLSEKISVGESFILELSEKAWGRYHYSGDEEKWFLDQLMVEGEQHSEFFGDAVYFFIGSQAEEEILQLASIAGLLKVQLNERFPASPSDLAIEVDRRLADFYAQYKNMLVIEPLEIIDELNIPWCRECHHWECPHLKSCSERLLPEN